MPYVRKYAGPLKPGSKSAYVPGMRKNKPSYRTKPSRLYSGKSTYNRTRRITNTVMKSISEAKYQGHRSDCLETVAKPAGTIRPLSYIFLNTGVDTTANLPEFKPLNLFEFPNGTGNTERVGKYMYIKKTHLKINVMALPEKADPDNKDSLLNTPLECRMVIVKANRKNDKIFTSPDPGNSLFLDTQNGSFGYDETGGSINLLQSQPINKRQWIKYRDFKFKMSPPAIQLDSEQNIEAYQTGKQYPVKREFKFDLPIYKKTHFSDSSNTPDDVDTQWLIILQVSYANHCLSSGSLAPRPRNIRMDVLGTTTALDN